MENNSNKRILIIISIIIVVIGSLIVANLVNIRKQNTLAELKSDYYHSLDRYERMFGPFDSY